MVRMTEGAGRAVRGAGRVAVKTAKVAGGVVLPAAPVAVKLARGQISVAQAAQTHMQALRAGQQGAKVGALASVGRGIMNVSAFALPVLAGVAAISAARDVYRRKGNVEDAAAEGAYAAGDLVLGGAMTEYNRARQAGESRAAAITSGALEGINNRFFFGYGDEIVATIKDPSKAGSIWSNAAPQWLKSAAGIGTTGGVDPTTQAIVQHEQRQQGGPSMSADMARGLADLSGMTRNPGGPAPQLTEAQAHEFARANAAYATKRKAAAQATAKTRDADGKPIPGASGETRRGWANPAVQKAAQQARGVEKFSDWTDDTVKSA